MSATSRTVLRFDMLRAPFARASAGELYREAIEMAAWADDHGVDLVGFSEHHVTEDGFLPTPLDMAAAVSGRTRRVGLSVSALLANLHDPLQLAERIVVLDLLSAGRFSVTVGLGYREVEYAAFGVPWRGRGRLLDERLEWILGALRGEARERHGVPLRLSPLPESAVMRLVTVGGNSTAAARRAARLGLVFCPAIDDPELARAYREEAMRAGTGPGLVVMPEAPSTTLIDEDPDRAWAEAGRFLLHHARTYGSWAHPDRRAYAVSAADSLEALRREGKYRILSPDEATAVLRSGGSLHLAPITAGLSPAFGWRTLELYAARVRPALEPPAAP